MKRIEDLTHEELIALTDDQIETFIQIEIAEAGIKPCVVPNPPNPIDAGIVKDDIFFSVAGILFRNKEDAVRVASMDIFTERYEWNIGYDWKWAEKNIDLKIEEKAFYKQQDCLRVAPILQRQKSIKDEYLKEKEAYDKWLSSTAQYRNDVWRIIHEAHEKERQIKNAVDALNQYKTIAGGDTAIALNFFNKAFNDESQEIKSMALARINLDSLAEGGRLG